jgi:hypothetical protein
MRSKRMYSICVRDWKGEPLEVGRYSDLGQAIIVLLALECENDFIELHSIRVREKDEERAEGS